MTSPLNSTSPVAEVLGKQRLQLLADRIRGPSGSASGRSPIAKRALERRSNGNCGGRSDGSRRTSKQWPKAPRRLNGWVSRTSSVAMPSREQAEFGPGVSVRAGVQFAQHGAVGQGESRSTEKATSQPDALGSRGVQCEVLRARAAASMPRSLTRQRSRCSRREAAGSGVSVCVTGRLTSHAEDVGIMCAPIAYVTTVDSDT